MINKESIGKRRKRTKMLLLLVHYIMNQIRRLSIKMHGVLSCPAQKVGIYKRKKESKKKRKKTYALDQETDKENDERK